MSIPVTQKRRGRPPTGETPQIGVRISPFQLAHVEAFADRLGVARSEAIRELIEIGLAAAAANDEPDVSRLDRIDLWRDEDDRSASRANAVKLLVEFALENCAPSRSE